MIVASARIFEEREELAEARGETRRKAEMALMLLRAKFHRVPKDVEESIRRMVDPVALDSLAASILDCQTMKEFVATLK